MSTQATVTHRASRDGNATFTRGARVEKQAMARGERDAIAVSIVAIALLLITQLFAVWPAAVSAMTKPTGAVPSTTVLFGAWHATFDADVAPMVMVVLVGGIAALVGVSRRFLDFALRDELTRRDQWSYLLRPFQGAVLALIAYFTLRGGFLGQDQSAALNPYGVAAISALVGLFTRHAVSKLSDVFDTVFGVPKDDREPAKVEAREPAHTPVPRTH
jgi:hypothetical protein